MIGRRAFLGVLALLTACTVAPLSVDGGPAVTPTGWIATVATVDTSLAVALPLMEDAVPLLGLAPATASSVISALNAADTVALPAVNQALATYQAEATTANLCGASGARAAIDALVIALEGVADTLGALNWALAPAVDLALQGLGGILDETQPACAVDASSPGFGASITAHLALRPAGLRPYPSLPSHAHY